jgi:hypothetical protein
MSSASYGVNGDKVMTFQAVAKFSNDERLCICEITDAEAALAVEDSPFVDGFGLYLVRVSASNPKAPAVVLAKFTSEEAATKMANFFRFTGTLDQAA